MRTDRHTGHTDLTKIKVAFSNFAKVPKTLKATDNVMCIVRSLFFSNALAGGRQHRGFIVPQTVTHGLVLLKMGKIISQNMLS
jgi:hypothetical protein